MVRFCTARCKTKRLMLLRITILIAILINSSFFYLYWKDKLQSDKLAFKRFDMEWLGCSSFYADVDYPCKQKQDACDVVGFCKRPNATRTWRAAYTAAIYRSSFVCFRINGDTAARACSSVQRCPRRRSDARELLVGFTPTLLHGRLVSASRIDTRHSVTGDRGGQPTTLVKKSAGENRRRRRRETMGKC